MDIVIPLFFFLIAFICFIIAWYEERTPGTDEDDEEEKDYMTIAFFTFATIFFVFSGITFLYITEVQYHVLTDSYTTVFHPEYNPFGYGIVGIAIVSLILTLAKAFDRL